MRLSLDALYVLDAIDRKGSFAAAAEELHRVPSAVTYAVQKLEQDLGVTLFDRRGHRAELTEAGTELLREGRLLLNAAGELEARVKRVATGYEAELRIAVSDVITLPNLFPVLEAFYSERCGTRLRLLTEVYGGCWDALATGRADLAVGAPAEGPAGGGYTARLLGAVGFVFVAAPNHAILNEPQPLSEEQIRRYRAVSAADSSRNLPPRTSGLLTGQDVLTVPDMRAKIAAHRAGLGVGYLPRHLALPEVAAGHLRILETVEPKPEIQMFLAWRSSHQGKALQWLVDQLSAAGTRDRLLNSAGTGTGGGDW